VLHSAYPQMNRQIPWACPWTEQPFLAPFRTRILKGENFTLEWHFCGKSEESPRAAPTVGIQKPAKMLRRAYPTCNAL